MGLSGLCQSPLRDASHTYPPPPPPPTHVAPSYRQSAVEAMNQRGLGMAASATAEAPHRRPSKPFNHKAFPAKSFQLKQLFKEWVSMHQAHCWSFQPQICIGGSLLFNMTTNATWLLHHALCLRVQLVNKRPQSHKWNSDSTVNKITAFNYTTSWPNFSQY